MQSLDTITLVAPSLLYQQYQVLSLVNEEMPISFEETTDRFCDPSNIVYTMSVTPKTTG
jgi:hypothetical protein